MLEKIGIFFRSYKCENVQLSLDHGHLQTLTKCVFVKNILARGLPTSQNLI